MSTEYLASQKMADPEGFEPSVCHARTPDSTGDGGLAERKSSPKSSPKVGIDCSLLTQVVDEWPFLSPALRLAVLAIIDASEKGRGGE